MPKARRRAIWLTLYLIGRFILYLKAANCSLFCFKFGVKMVLKWHQNNAELVLLMYWYIFGTNLVLFRRKTCTSIHLI
ncbi:Uncharacterised protein [Escherichia coli]|uniref:Uncharacterized protein n=1 Tax=Escherichia coli TaxID=562 RepID=A0A2X1LVI6_ECOLX|nr:Uncharacterised protein [Escherichia coli]